jgi:hypothetical protein
MRATDTTTSTLSNNEIAQLQPMAGRWVSGYEDLGHAKRKNNPLYVLMMKPIAPKIVEAWGKGGSSSSSSSSDEQQQSQPEPEAAAAATAAAAVGAQQ